MKTEQRGKAIEEAALSTEEAPRRLRWQRLLFPLVLAVLAVGIVADSVGLGIWVRLGPGPGFFPLVLGALLGLLALLWIAQELRTHRAVDPKGAAPEPAHEMPGFEAEEQPLRVAQVATIVVSLVVLAVLMPLIGYQLSMLAFLIFHLRFVGRRRWWLTVLLAVIGSFGVFVLFSQVLAVKLPAASIEFLRVMGF